MRNFVERDVSLGFHRQPPIGGFRFFSLFAACFAAITFLLVNNRAHAHKRMRRRTMPSRDRGQKRNDKASDGGEWNEQNCRCQSLREQIVIVIMLLLLFFLFAFKIWDEL